MVSHTPTPLIEVLFTCSSDFILVFKVYYSVMISEPVSFSHFQVNAFPLTLISYIFTPPSEYFTFQPVCPSVSDVGNFCTTCTMKSDFQNRIHALGRGWGHMFYMSIYS